MKIIIIKSKKYGNKECLVDDEDYQFLNLTDWSLFTDEYEIVFYAVRHKRINGKCIRIRMHREILKLKTTNEIVDHKDRNGLNNQKNNLRVCSQTENKKNRTPYGSSKFLGVHLNTSKVKDGLKRVWGATIKGTYIGIYETEIEAAQAYDKKAKELHGEFANLNFKD